MTQEIDLASLFQSVTQTMQQNQSALNQADEVNRDHGNNMVQTFQTITRALQARQGKPASTALAYAAKQLSKNTTSGSGQLYAQSLAQAATQFKGKPIDTRGAMQLLQTLIGGGQAPQSSGGDLLGSLLGGQSAQGSSPSTGGDLLGTLLGGMASGGESPEQPSGQSGDMLGSLLGGLLGGGSAPASGSESAGLDMGDLLNAGMRLLGGGQSSSSPLGNLIQAFTSSSGMGNSTHRDQSTALVVNAFLQALGALSKR